MRKILRMLIILATMLCCMLALACCAETENNEQGNNEPPVTEPETPDDDPRAYWIKVNYETVDMFVGEQFTLIPELYLGETLVEGAAFEWESLKPSIATVSDGEVTAAAAGEASIRIRASEHENVETTVLVNCIDPLTLDLSLQTVELAKIEFQDYATTVDVEYEVKWKDAGISDAVVTVSVSNDNVSAIVQDGKIVLTANAIGDAVVTASCEYQSMTVETRINVSVVKPFVQTDETYLFSTGTQNTGTQNTIDLSLIEETSAMSAEDVVSVYSDASAFPILSKEGTVVQISETASLGYDGTVTTPVTIEFEDLRVGISLTGYTHVIRTVQDFDNMKLFLEDTTLAAQPESGLEYCKRITGYYILANNLDFSTEYPDGYSSPFGYRNVGYVNRGYTHGWMATFDGNGYSISNLKLNKSALAGGAWCNSLFGVIAGNGGTVKNVAFVNCSLASDLLNSAFLANLVYGTIENVYLDVTLTTNTGNANGNSAFVGMAASQGVMSTDNATTISDVTVVVRSLGENDYVMKGTPAGLQSIKGQFVTIGAAENKVNVNYATISDLETANENISAYTDTAAAAEDAALTACGSASFALAEQTFTITWNGKSVYTQTIAAE